MNENKRILKVEQRLNTEVKQLRKQVQSLHTRISIVQKNSSSIGEVCALILIWSFWVFIVYALVKSLIS